MPGFLGFNYNIFIILFHGIWLSYLFPPQIYCCEKNLLQDCYMLCA